MTDKELDAIEAMADVMIAEPVIAHRLLRVHSIGIVYKKLISEIRKLKGRTANPLSIVSGQ